MTEFEILTKCHGSALLAELVMERRRIRAKYRPLGLLPQPPKAPPPPPRHNIKPLQERLAEMDLLPELSRADRRKIRSAILWSGLSHGEFMVTSDPPPRVAVPGKPTVVEIQKFAAFHFNVSHAAILKVGRPLYVALPRQIAMYLSRLLTPYSFPQIARMFHRVDHTTIIHAVRKIAKLMAGSWWFTQIVETLKARLLRQVVNG